MIYLRYQKRTQFYPMNSVLELYQVEWIQCLANGQLADPTRQQIKTRLNISSSCTLCQKLLTLSKVEIQTNGQRLSLRRTPTGPEFRQSPSKVLGHFHLIMVAQSHSIEHLPSPSSLNNVVFSRQMHFPKKQHCFGVKQWWGGGGGGTLFIAMGRSNCCAK